MLIVQLGAHGHESTSYENTADRVPAMIEAGASAILVEPQTFFFDKLRTKYANNPDVTVLNQAVCAADRTFTELYSVDINSADNFGSLHADGRCANITTNPNSTSMWVTEIATLSRAQLMKQAYLFQNSPSQCRACSRVLGLEKPPNCMRDLVEANLRRTRVECVRWPSVLPPGRRVDLLMIDVEGHEAHAIKSFPFATNPVGKVRFEAKHIRDGDALKRINRTLTDAGLSPLSQGDDETWQSTKVVEQATLLHRLYRGLKRQ